MTANLAVTIVYLKSCALLGLRRRLTYGAIRTALSGEPRLAADVAALWRACLNEIAACKPMLRVELGSKYSAPAIAQVIAWLNARNWCAEEADSLSGIRSLYFSSVSRTAA